MDPIRLPDPAIAGEPALARAINERKSCRAFSADSLTLEEAGQIMWAANGVRIGEKQARTVPSAGACYPLEVFLVTGQETVSGIDAGVYRYDPPSHTIVLHRSGDFRAALANASLHQKFIGSAPMTIFLAADPAKTTKRYGGDRGMRYVYMDVGHAGQNICLQATALGLGTVAVGAFRDNDVLAALNIPGQLKPLYLFPIGKPKKKQGAAQ